MFITIWKRNGGDGACFKAAAPKAAAASTPDATKSDKNRLTDYITITDRIRLTNSVGEPDARGRTRANP